MGNLGTSHMSKNSELELEFGAAQNPYYSIVHTTAALCQLSTYLLVLGFPKLYKYLPPYTRSDQCMYLVCTRYVLLRTGTYSEKQTKRKCKTFRFEPWISCIASCALHHQTTSVHSMVISWVKTWYIAPETYTCIARYLLAGVGRQEQVLQRPRLLPWRQLEFPETHFGSARDGP